MKGIALVPDERLDVLWLDDSFAMNHSTWGSITGTALAPPQALGGIFTSSPVAVAVSSTRLDVFGLGLDYALYHKVYDATAPAGIAWSVDWENLGGNLTSTPAVVATAPGRIDVFGLGADQSLTHRAWNGSGWTVWHELGGGFTSAPCVLPVTGGTFDLFARGLDFQIYHALFTPNVVPTWAPLGGGLLGAPTAASAPCAVRVPNGMLVFVTADDGAVWTTLFDGRAWKPWSSLGPAQAPPLVPKVIDLNTEPTRIAFASEPVARALSAIVPTTLNPGAGRVQGRASIASGATSADPPQPAATDFSDVRVDVLAVGSDKAIWHKWLDAGGWHGATATDSSETGNWVQVPDQSSAGQPSPTSCVCAPSLVSTGVSRNPMATPTSDLKMIAPSSDGALHLLTYDGTSWSSWTKGPRFRLPSFYTFALDDMTVEWTRSAFNDTDIVVATLAVGKWPVKSVTLTGPVNVGSDEIGPVLPLHLAFGPLVVETCEPVAWAFTIVNTSQSGMAAAIIKGAEDAVNDVVKNIVSPPLVGSLLSAGLTSFALDPLLTFLFANCDGVIAAQTIPYQKGRDIESLVANTSAAKYASATRFLGSDSNEGCGSHNSDYTVNWSITRATL